MPKEKGFAQVFLILLLLIGLGVGIYLVQQRTNLIPKAYETKPPTSTRFPDISGRAKITTPPRSGEAKISLSGTAFEDLDRNSIMDFNEVYVKNIPILVYLLYTLNSNDSETTITPIKSSLTAGQYYSIVSISTDSEGKWSAEFYKPDGLIDGIFATPGKGTVEPENPDFVGIYDEPYGWERLPLKDTGYLEFAKGSLVGEPIVDDISNTTYTDIDFPVIGVQKISGRISSIYDYRGINILLDASIADNYTRKLYVAKVNDDWTYEIKDLPPLSKYKIKATAACPYKVVTSPYEGFTLGSAGLTEYNFGVLYDENDPCVTN